MKSILKTSTAIAVLLCSLTGLAKEPMLRLTHKEDVRTLTFRLDTPSKETVIRFFDNLGNTIYSEKTGDVATYGKKFDLMKLADGYYFLEVEDSFKEIVYTIEVSTEDAKVINKEEKLKPVFRKKGNRLFLNLLNPKESNVEIKVLDSSNRVIYREVVEGQLVVEKAINFENAFEDNYTVVVSNEGNTYYENISVE